MSKRYLVTGGAGFVGSHVVLALLDRGHEVVVFDNLSLGHRAAVPAAALLIEGDLADAKPVHKLLAEGPWDGVLHFAAISLVGESMKQPFRYLADNPGNGIRLIEACIQHRVKRFVLSSTAAVFGSAGDEPLTEQAVINPGSPYGESKHMIERALRWADECFEMRSACLRYFNAAGADAEGRAGEDHSPETHLIPLVIDAALGRRPEIAVFGTDYPTPDGTCIRSVERVGGRKVSVRLEGRRAGDPAVLVAASGLIQSETAWRPHYTALDDIVRTAWVWREAHPHGYGTPPVAVTT